MPPCLGLWILYSSQLNLGLRFLASSINNDLIFEEMYNLNYECDLLIPTIYENNPYAYLNLDEHNNVINFGYKKNKSVDYGYHDQCIFLFDTKLLLEKLERIIQKKYNELNLLDVVEHFDIIKYYETDYGVKSFNTLDELNKIYYNTFQ